jgi:tRNA(Ile)-lysidine synthase
VIPFVERSFPEVNDNLLANINRFKEVALLYQQAVDVHKKKLLEFKGKEVHIPVLKLKKTTPLSSVIYEVIKDYHFSPAQVNEIIALLDSESGRYVQSTSHRVIKNRNWLIIAPNESTGSEIVVIDAIGDWSVAMGKLKLELTSVSTFEPKVSNNVASVDFDEMQFPLLLRKWKQGDYFYPLGMKKKKKLARFFIDQKLSKTDKEKVWVIEMNKKIVWVVGYRIDDRFKITSSSRQILKLTFQE